MVFSTSVNVLLFQIEATKRFSFLKHDLNKASCISKWDLDWVKVINSCCAISSLIFLELSIIYFINIIVVEVENV